MQHERDVPAPPHRPVPALAVATLAATPPVPLPSRAPAPAGRTPFPPCAGTKGARGRPAARAAGGYVCVRNLAQRHRAGRTTVVALHRDEGQTIETDEAGVAEAARAHVVTYQAPFPRDVPLGASEARRSHGGLTDQQTLRYRTDSAGAAVTLDGLRGEQRIASPDAYVFDAPFMTGPLFAPGIRAPLRRRTLTAVLASVLAGHEPLVPRVVAAAPQFPKTPKTDSVRRNVR